MEKANAKRRIGKSWLALLGVLLVLNFSAPGQTTTDSKKAPKKPDKKEAAPQSTNLFGVRGGMALSFLNISPSVKQTPYQGFTAAAFWNYFPENHLGFRLEVGVSQLGWQEFALLDPVSRLPYDGPHIRDLTYVETPLLSSFSIGSGKVRPIINAGYYMAWVIAETYRTGAVDLSSFLTIPDTRIYRDKLTDHQLLIGSSLGAGVEWLVSSRSRLGFEVRYTFVFTNLFERYQTQINQTTGTSIRQRYQTSQLNAFNFMLHYSFDASDWFRK